MDLSIIQRCYKKSEYKIERKEKTWYCLTCNLQFENHRLFLNHLTTESHRQKKHSSNNERQNLSETFVKGFMEILSKFKRKRVPARMVLQAYNALNTSISIENTQWTTLQEFLYWLKCCKKCRVNETFDLIQELGKENPKSMETLERKKHCTKVKRESLCPYVRKMLKLDKNSSSSNISERAKLSRNSNEKINFTFSKRSRQGYDTSPSIGRKRDTDSTSIDASELHNPIPHSKVRDQIPSSTIEVHLAKIQKDQASTNHPEETERNLNKFINSLSSLSENKTKDKSRVGIQLKSQKRKRSALEDIKDELETDREKLNRTASWITLGLQVRIVSNFAGKHNQRKVGTVVYCSISDDNYLIQIQDSVETVSVRQQDLQTVIPNPGSPVRIVNGGYRGLNAILDSVDKKFLAGVHITNGLLSGRVVSDIPLNDICAFKDVTFKS